MGLEFSVKDLKGWQITRHDGTTVRYELRGGYNKPPIPKAKGEISTIPQFSGSSPNHTKWCMHEGENWIVDDPHADKTITYHIGDAIGARKVKFQFDILVDCGNIFPTFPTTPPAPIPVIGGNDYFTERLKSHAPPIEVKKTEYIKINWPDQGVPRCLPSFWEALRDTIRDYAKLEGLSKTKVLLACQGGHGRSGTAAVCMALACYPDYPTARAAVLHVRALHCEQAIESKAQADYIDQVAKHLKRRGGAALADKVSDSAKAFLRLSSKDKPNLKRNQVILATELEGSS